MNGYEYRCAVSSTAGTVYSNGAKLTVISTYTPVITTHPTATSAAVGTRATFSVVASGENLTYQWQYRKTASSGWVDSKGTNYSKATFTPSVSASMNGYEYRCAVSNTAGTVYSNGAKLTVTSAETLPVITSQPKPTSAVAGGKAIFVIEASGENLVYQWQYRKPGTTAWVDSHGVNYNKATFTPVTSKGMNGYEYRCVVSNSAGPVESEAALLSVY